MDRRILGENIMQSSFTNDKLDNFDYEQLTCVEEAEKALNKIAKQITPNAIRDHISEIG